MTRTNWMWLIACGFVGAACAAAAAAPPAGAGPVSPYEKSVAFRPANPIDLLVLAELKPRGITPAGLCSDEVFIRRVHLDVIGVLPTAREVTAFVNRRDPNKRARLIEQLLKRDEFADYWAMKWCDVLRVKSRVHPINLWPNGGAGVPSSWIRQSRCADNMPYDRFARAIADLQRLQLPRAAGQLLPRDAGHRADDDRRRGRPDVHGHAAIRKVARASAQARI
jgi:hypothetical protein